MYNATFRWIKARRSHCVDTRHRFVVLQPGARLHYAVPALLARAGMLERLYTDVHAPAGPLSAMLRRARLPAPAARWLGRALPPELHGLVSSVPVRALADRLAGAARLPRPWRNAELRLADQIVHDAFRGASALYVLSNAHLELVRIAKQRGMFVVHEQICHPHIGRTVREERLRFPGLEPVDSAEEVERGIERDLAQWSLADLILAPSRFVGDAVVASGIPERKVAVVPYGLPDDWLSSEPAPVSGRVLFVGAVGLLKGVHYLASASRELKRRGVPHEVRVVGMAPRGARSSPLFAGVSLVGPVPRSRIREEFRAADLFVFPTLSESFALVHLEALASGVPVITTPNCGSVVRDGVDGFIVPIRSPESVADRVQELLGDRALRAQMSRSARSRAAEFTWGRFGDRLLEALRSASR